MASIELDLPATSEAVKRKGLTTTVVDDGVIRVEGDFERLRTFCWTQANKNRADFELLMGLIKD